MASRFVLEPAKRRQRDFEIHWLGKVGRDRPAAKPVSGVDHEQGAGKKVERGYQHPQTAAKFARALCFTVIPAGGLNPGPDNLRMIGARRDQSEGGMERAGATGKAARGLGICAIKGGRGEDHAQAGAGRRHRRAFGRRRRKREANAFEGDRSRDAIGQAAHPRYI